MAHVGCGIDIGGSGVKGALVDLTTGEFIGERVRIDDLGIDSELLALDADEEMPALVLALDPGVADVAQ